MINQCIICETDISHKRNRARYCSPRCNKRGQRASKRYNKKFSIQNTTGLCFWCESDKSDYAGYCSQKCYQKALSAFSFYGLNRDEYFEFIKNGCELCGTMENLHIDHDHACCPTSRGNKKTCGECLRGVLCANHNQMLGKAQDDPSVLLKAIKYLEKTKKDIKS